MMIRLRRRLRRALRQIFGLDLSAKPEISIPKSRLGTINAEWCIAEGKLNRDSIVYCAGVGTDVSFDLGLIERFGCEVHALDPTPKCIDWLAQQKLPAIFKFYPVGFSDVDGVLEFSPPSNAEHVSFSTPTPGSGTILLPVQRIRTFAEKLGHRHIDLIKLDIEGSEYAVIDDLVREGPMPQQLLIEFHHGMYGIPLVKTATALATLRNAGYRIFDVSPTGREISFIQADNFSQRAQS